ncbi:MAG: hypothetical protein GKC10_04195 [Methanosarcinales archaeon]|nr:hypothetical protein [Methanosarcinales archaeon]
MQEIHLLCGRPLIKDRMHLISAIREIQSASGSVIAALDARLVVSDRHAAFAAKKALLALAEGRNVAKDPSLEILRYASGQRQIEKALLMGPSQATERMVLVVVGDLPGEASSLVDEDGLGCTTWKKDLVMEAFGISDDEIEAVGLDRLPDLVIERVALVDAYR